MPDYVNTSVANSSIFKDPIITPTYPDPASTLVILGLADGFTSDDIAQDAGKASLARSMEPVRVRDYDDAVYHFKSGRLVEACREAFLFGAPNVYLMRLNSQDKLAPSSDETYALLASAYEVLDNFPASFFLLDCVDFEDEASPGSFAQQLVEFCAGRDQRFSSFGVMKTKALVSEGDTPSFDEVRVHANRLLDSSLLQCHFYANNIDAGGFLSVVASEVKALNSGGDLASTSGASAYAALLARSTHLDGITAAPVPVTQLRFAYHEQVEKSHTFSTASEVLSLERAPINTPLVTRANNQSTGKRIYTPGVDYRFYPDPYDGQYKLRNVAIPTGEPVTISYSCSYLDSLASMGYVVFRDDVRQGVVVHRAVTAASPQSGYASFHSARRVQAISQAIASLGDDAVGESLVRAKFEASVRAIVTRMATPDWVREWTLEITYEAQDALVKLNLQPYSDTQALSSTVQVPITQGVR